MLRFVCSLVCVLIALAAEQGLVHADPPGGCGTLNAITGCPGCVSSPMGIGCICNSQTGICTTSKGVPHTPARTCHWGHWTWNETGNEEDPTISATWELCQTTRICEPALPMFDCSGVNECQVHTYYVCNWRYYELSPTCEFDPT
jgi:hypothetical protein